MGHKKVGVRLGLSLLAVAIVIPLASRVNHIADVSKQPKKSKNLRTDGAAIPLLPPYGTVLVADGPPVPPLPPPKGTSKQILSAVV